MILSIQSNHFKTFVSNVSFNWSNNEIYLTISLHSRSKSIVFYSRIMARSDELRHSPATRDTKSPHEYPIAIIIRSLNNILLFVEIPVPNLFCWQYQKKNLWGNLKNRFIVLK
jgi:hypothetical protein